MRVLDLFSGIGGFSLGLERTGGFETKLFCELDKSCREVLSKHWPSVRQHDDIKTLSVEEGEYDVITGGFPCQDISVAGTRKGLEGGRSGLWSEYKRVIKEAKPKYVIIENSSNLRNLGLETVLKDLWEAGYDAEWLVLEAGQFGAPHVRERIFVVAYPVGTRRERLVKDEYLEEIGSWGLYSKEDLQGVYANPFTRSDCWPEPLLRGVDDGVPRRMDRLKQVGNSVYVPIVTFLGECILKEGKKLGQRKQP